MRLKANCHRGISLLTVGCDISLNPMAEKGVGRDRIMIGIETARGERLGSKLVQLCDPAPPVSSAVNVSLIRCKTSFTRFSNSFIPIACNKILIRALYLLSRRPIKLYTVKNRLEVGNNPVTGTPENTSLPRRGSAPNHHQTNMSKAGPDSPRTMLAQPNVVCPNYRPVFCSGANSNLEFSSAETEIPDDPSTTAGSTPHKVGRSATSSKGSARKMIGGDVANSVTTGLDSVHIELRQRLQNVRCINQARPIELECFAGW